MMMMIQQKMEAVIRFVFHTPHSTLPNFSSLLVSSLFPHKRTRLVLTPSPWKRTCTTTTHLISQASQKEKEEVLVVVGGGAAGVYGAIHAKTVAPHLNVVIIEKGKSLTKVKVSGGGRCNVTNGHCVDNLILAENYPRGHKELRGSFFKMHAPADTMSWFASHGVELKIEDDGRVFPVSNCSSSIIDCLMSEVKQRGVSMQTKKSVTAVSVLSDGKFLLDIKQQSTGSLDHVEADYLLIATGSNRQGYALASQLGHSIVDPVPSLFTFKIEDLRLRELSGVTFPKVKVRLKLESLQRNVPQLTQVGPMLVTHWGLSGPAILRLSAWGARHLFSSSYRGRLIVDFIPDVHVESLKSLLSRHKLQFAGQFKDEFVTAGGVPLSEISLNTMESKVCSNLFFAGEILNVDGVTGGFNFQNAWSGGFVAGTTIGGLALDSCLGSM